MKLFPSDTYEVQLQENFEEKVELLKSCTKYSLSLASSITDKKFIGMVDGNGFKLIGSEIGIGAFVVFHGSMGQKAGVIKTQINPPFKFIFFLLLILPALFTIYEIIANGWLYLSLLLPLAMNFVFVRYIMMGLAYKVSSTQTLDKLKAILTLTSLVKQKT